MLPCKPKRRLLFLMSRKRQIKRKAQRKRSVKPAKKRKKTSKTSRSSSASTPKRTTASTKSRHTTHRRNRTAPTSIAALDVTEKCTTRKGRKPHCVKGKGTLPVSIADAHRAKVQKATKTAMSKLMNQIGKPYHWGGASPRTGFDCSGLVYYAYKDLVKIRIPERRMRCITCVTRRPLSVAS